MGQKPEPMSLDTLATTLELLAAAVRAGDSLEGHIEWLLPAGPEDTMPEGTDVLVRAGFRTGNRNGQGGFTTIGSYLPDPVLPAIVHHRTYPGAAVRSPTGQPRTADPAPWVEAGHCARCAQPLWRTGDGTLFTQAALDPACPDGQPHHPTVVTP